MDLFHNAWFSSKPKKRCMVCGCHMHPDSETNICECCVADMNEGDEEEW